MNREEASFILANIDRRVCDDELNEALDMAIKALDQEPCEMTAEEYRQRMIQAFHNADTDELITICVLPTEKEFEHLEWLLKNHYKKEPCDKRTIKHTETHACVLISRQDVLDLAKKGVLISNGNYESVCKAINEIPSAEPKTGHWIDDNENEIDAQYGRHLYKCSECNEYADMFVGGTEDWWDIEKPNYCPNCGCRMVEPQESEDKG